MTEFLAERHTESLTELLTELPTESLTESITDIHTELVSELLILPLTDLPSFMSYILNLSGY
jgi:hypothetical protein